MADQDDDRELIRRFQADAIRPFTEAELADDLSGQAVPARAVQGRSFSLGDLKLYENLKPFVLVLEEALARFEFGKHSLEEWRTKYIFPRRSSLKRFARRQFDSPSPVPAADLNCVVNQSAEHVAWWVNDVLIRSIVEERRKGPDPVFILAGGTGAGKSSLNKYITSVHFPDFVAKKIVTSRIEYRKLHTYLRVRRTFIGNDQEHIADAVRRRAQKYVICCCARDVLHSSFTALEKQADGHTRLRPSTQLSPLGVDLRDPDAYQAFSDFFEKTLAHRSKTTFGEVCAAIQRAATTFQSEDMVKRTDWFSNLVNNSADSDTFIAMEVYLAFCRTRGVRVHLIFDGFDFIQASDFLQDTTHALVLNTLSRWIIADGGRLILPMTRQSFKPSVQVTMRTGTVETFWKDQSLAFGPFNSQDYYVAPPELRDIYNSVTRRVEEEHPEFASWNTDAGIDVFQGVQRALADVTGLTLTKTSALFLENTRHRINYVRHVLEAALRDALVSSGVPARDPRTLRPGDLAVILWDAVAQMSSGKNYRLIEVLLQSKGDRFANFIRVEKIGRWSPQTGADSRERFLAESVLQDNNIKSGYVGNIFNYHIPYTSFDDLHFFLEKVRILELLRGKKRLSLRQIEAKFRRNKWRTSPYLDISIAILVRETLIEGVFAEPDGQYQITPLGDILVGTLIGQMRYLENIYFGCLIPGEIAVDSVDILRGAARRIDWVVAALFHVWILLRMIKTAEGEGTAFAFERARASVFIAVQRIVETGFLGKNLAHRVLKRMDALDARLDRSVP